MFTWRPPWILGSAGFRKEPSSSGPQHKKCQVNRSEQVFLRYSTDTKPGCMTHRIICPRKFFCGGIKRHKTPSLYSMRCIYTKYRNLHTCKDKFTVQHFNTIQYLDTLPILHNIIYHMVYLKKLWQGYLQFEAFHIYINQPYNVCSSAF
jgi:hypothetical protein